MTVPEPPGENGLPVTEDVNPADGVHTSDVVVPAVPPVVPTAIDPVPPGDNATGPGAGGVKVSVGPCVTGAATALIVPPGDVSAPVVSANVRFENVRAIDWGGVTVPGTVNVTLQIV